MSKRRSHKKAARVSSGLKTSDHSKTNRQKAFSDEWMARLDPYWREAAPGSEMSVERSKYEKALYGKCRKSERKRRAFDCLNDWRRNVLAAQADGGTLDLFDWIVLLDPLIGAISGEAEIDEEFLKGFWEAAQILNNRTYSSRNPDIGTAIDKWLLEYKSNLRWGNAAEYTPYKLNEQQISKFYSISDKKLHEKLHELKIPHRDELRGKANPNYGAQLNLPRKRRKKGKY
jgi:hypothetical protein